jgi:acyl-CoA thioesterase-1
MVKLDEIALTVMKENGVVIDDLHNHILPTLSEHQNPKDVHFNAAGYDKLAAKVTSSILESLSAK